MTLVRYENDGSRDFSFGRQGIARAALTARAAFSSAYATFVEESGEITVAGAEVVVKDGKQSSHVLLARFDAHGKLQTRFGTQGIVSIPLGEQTIPYSIARQAGGNWVVMGGQDPFAFALRLTSEGKLDATFGEKGIARVTLGGAGFRGRMQSDGKILIAGAYGVAMGKPTELALVRLDPDGHPDASFGDGGLTHTPLETGARAVDVLVDKNGRILLAGSSAQSLVLARYLENGAPDKTFGTGGFVFRPLPGDVLDVEALAASPDGKLVVAASALSPPQTVLARFSENGDRDPGFGEDGLAAFPLAPKFMREAPAALAVASDGNPIIAGVANDSCNMFWLLERFTPQGMPDSSFGNQGRILQSFQP